MFRRLRKVNTGYNSLFYGGSPRWIKPKYRFAIFGIILLCGLYFGFYSSFVCNEKVCEIQNENHMHIIIKRQPIDIENLEGFSMYNHYLYAVMKDGTSIKTIAQGFDNDETLRRTAIRLNDNVKLYRSGKNINVFIH